MAALDLVTGQVVHQIRGRSRSDEFIEFLEKLDGRYPADTLICILLDNHPAHISIKTRGYLETKKGRFELIYLPKHGSWLNAIEGFFSKVARSLLRHIRVKTVDELISRIDRYIDLNNQKPIPPNWIFGLHAQEPPT